MASSLPLTLLSAGRLAIGTAFFLFPSFACTNLFYPLPDSSLLAARLFGSRDALLATLLFTAKTPEMKRRAVLVGAAADVLDIAALVFGYAQGDVKAETVGSFGGGAVAFLVLAGMGWKGVKLGQAMSKT